MLIYRNNYIENSKFGLLFGAVRKNSSSQILAIAIHGLGSYISVPAGEIEFVRFSDVRQEWTLHLSAANSERHGLPVGYPPDVGWETDRLQSLRSLRRCFPVAQVLGFAVGKISAAECKL